MKLPILFPNTPVTALTWYWFMGPTYAILNLLTVLISPSAESNFIAYVLMCAGSSLALWMYQKLGLARQPKSILGEWQTPMLSMWWRGTALVVLAAMVVPVLLHGLGFQQEQAVQFMVTFVMPLTLGFLVVSGFGVLIYAVIYQSLAQLVRFSQNR